jgi:transposase
MVDAALAELSPQFEALYSKVGRPSIPPEKLLRALLLQVLFTIRSERMLMEQLDYNLLYRWFVGLGMVILCGFPRFSARIATGCLRARSPKRS